LHTGGSCGYSGGCNNGSPDQPYMDMHINSFPAKLCIRLWKKMPTSKDAQADLYVIMVFQ